MNPRLARCLGGGAVAVSLAMSLLSAACAPDHGGAYPRAFAEAARAETAGRMREASEGYDAAAKVAVRDRDRDHALYLSGLTLLRSGDVRDGVAKLGAIARASPPREESPDAAYRVAAARIDHGDAARGWAEMEQVFVRFAGDGVAHAALKRVLVHLDETKGKAGAYDYLARLEATPAGSSGVGELILFEAAERLAALGRYAQAHDMFLNVATRWPYPFGALWDDSLFRASEMDESLGHIAHGIADLERMLQDRETTSLTGSYQRPRMSPALLRIAKLYADGLHDNGHAREALHRFYTDFTTSRARPTALWLEAELFREDADAGQSCDRLRVLVKEFPDSRYVPCASNVCGEVQRPAKSAAPNTCHAYLMLPHRFSAN